MNKNVNLWFARNSKEEIITINNVGTDDCYTCPICGSEVIPKAVNSNIISSHFAHLDKSKCTAESMIHFWIKNSLIKPGDEILLSNGRVIVINSISVESPIITEYGIYTPDVTIETNTGEILYMEINHTNKKIGYKYIRIWDKLKNTVIEVSSKDVINKIYTPDECIYNVIYENGILYIKENRSKYSYIEKIVNKYEIKDESLIGNLNWFWREIESYDKYNFDKTFIIITELLKLYGKDIISILNKAACSDIRKDYIDFKIKYIKSEINDIKNKDINVCITNDCSEYLYIEYSDENKFIGNIWSNTEYLIEMAVDFIRSKDEYIEKENIENEKRIITYSISDEIYKNINDRYSKIKIDCEYSKSSTPYYASKICIPHYGLYLFFKHDEIDICKSYEYSKPSYVYSRKRHRKTLRYNKCVGYNNLKTYDIKCNYNEIYDFICCYIRNKIYGGVN